MDECKQNIINVKNIILKINTFLINNKNFKINKNELHMFLQIKDNFVFVSELIKYFYNLYFINSYDYYNRLDDLIDLKTDFLLKYNE